MERAYRHKNPSFYEIAEKIIAFCDEMDKKLETEKDGGKE